MDPQPEFPMPDDGEREALRGYLQIERTFMASKHFFEKTNNIKHRKLAVSRIATLSEGEGVDAYIAYLAMNYYDRYSSKYFLFQDEEYPESEGYDVDELACFLATCCYTLAAKKRVDEFNLEEFVERKKYLSTKPESPDKEKLKSDAQPQEEKTQKREYLCYDVDSLTRMESRIQSKLALEMPPITAFCFLNFYYEIFQRIGGFKRRSINEIIIQSQGDYQLTQFKPSEIAKSAFLAASFIGYPVMFHAIKKLVDQSGELEACWRRMTQVCQMTCILIRSESGDVISPTTKAGYLELLHIRERQQQPVEAVVVGGFAAMELGDMPQQIAFNSRMIEEALVAPKVLMDFDLKWKVFLTTQNRMLLIQHRELGKVLPKPNENWR